MNREVYALLLDSRSIQSYVFGSNDLKENIGGSEIVQKLYSDFLLQAFESLKIKLDKTDLEKWQEAGNEVNVNNAKAFDIGYIGGGNALLFFKDKKTASDFVEHWTAILLVEAPGIQVAHAIEQVEVKDNQVENFKVFLTKLHDNLNQYKNSFHPRTSIPSHGITSQCPKTGFTRDVAVKLPGNNEAFLSSISSARRKAAKHSDERYKELLRAINNDNIEYEFPSEFDKINSNNEKSTIAVVHIDGNNMGQQFRGCKTLEDIRVFSSQIRQRTYDSFKKTLSKLFDYMKKEEYNQNFNTFHKNVDDNIKFELPIRPIIIGGDDITFVCDGKLGFFLAEIYMKYFQEPLKIKDKPVELSSCAGVSVVGLKYPFYRAYKLAEELCHSAKAKAREHKHTSWIDFHLSYGGLSGSLKQIRDSQYKNTIGKMYLRPYCIDEIGEQLSFQQIITIVRDFYKWPRSKVKELRSILSVKDSLTEEFKALLNRRGLNIPKYKNIISDSQLWFEEGGKKVTPYLDAIEILDIYPEKLMDLSMSDLNQKEGAGV